MTYRSFIRPPKADEQFLSHWSLPQGPDRDMAVRDRLARLSCQLYTPYPWKAPLAAGLEPWENPRIPAGYTYFAQFVAHDCVQSNVPTAAARAGEPGARNVRSSRLALDTLYGAGFDACAHASRALGNSARRLSKLPLGRVQDTRGPGRTCPFRDVARAPAADSASLSEVLLADDRNDNNVIVSQLTVLFSLFHNAIVDALAAAEPPPSTTDSYRHEARLFTEARRICTETYRRLIERDLMRRLLHPAVYERYSTQRCQFMDSSETVPREFPLIFRFGHSMVRPHYQFNDVYGRREELPDVLLTNSRGRPWRMPLDESWVVQWSRFFPCGEARPNLSRRIGPAFSPALVSDQVFASIDATECVGLAYRDLLQGTACAVWSVPALIAEVRRHVPGIVGGSRLRDDAAYREQALGAWLSSRDRGMPSALIGDLSRDPPLPLFVLLEAAHDCEGMHLGALGSLLVAEVVFKALRSDEPAPGASGSGVGNDPHAAAATREIDTMADLAKFVARSYQAAELPVPFV